MAPNLQTSFWTRMGLVESCQEACIQAIQDVYPHCEVRELEEQGYCSYTLAVSSRPSIPSTSHFNNPTNPSTVDYIVQIRPTQHTLDLEITQAASETYSSYAPQIRNLPISLPPRLQAFEMDRMPGTLYSNLQPRTTNLDVEAQKRQIALIETFATVIAKAWPSSTTSSSPPSRTHRADSPMSDMPLSSPDTDTNKPSTLPSPKCTGKVGSQILTKLHRLTQDLPTQNLRARAATTFSRMQELLLEGDYPIVLNHGDLIPTNILVSPDTCTITGVVDWAEAEFLPFGTCLYGLEHLLGYLETTTSSSPEKGSKRTWKYYSCAPALRTTFWQKLFTEIPDVRKIVDDMGVVRDAGVFLWYGYAWDEGAIDRVVNAQDDEVEVEMLGAFLGVDS